MISKLYISKLEANHVCGKILLWLTLRFVYSWEENSVRNVVQKITKILIDLEFLIFTINVCRYLLVCKHRGLRSRHVNQLLYGCLFALPFFINK